MSLASTLGLLSTDDLGFLVICEDADDINGFLGVGSRVNLEALLELLSTLAIAFAIEPALISPLIEHGVDVVIAVVLQ